MILKSWVFVFGLFFLATKTNTKLRTTMSMSNTELTNARLDHLFTSAHQIFTNSPSISRFLLSSFHDLAGFQHVRLPDRIQKKYCPKCGSLWNWGANASIKIVSSQDKKGKNGKKRNSKGRQQQNATEDDKKVHLNLNEDKLTNPTKKKKQKQHNSVEYKCYSCHFSSILPGSSTNARKSIVSIDNQNATAMDKVQHEKQQEKQMTNNNNQRLSSSASSHTLPSVNSTGSVASAKKKAKKKANLKSMISSLNKPKSSSQPTNLNLDDFLTSLE